MINLGQELNQRDISSKTSPNLALVNLCLSVTTLPFLVGIATLTHFHRSLIELGQQSEEIFRGERLPLS